MISSILATIAFLIGIEGAIISLFSKDVKKFMAELARKKDGDRMIRKIGLWELLIGLLLLVLAIVLRQL